MKKVTNQHGDCILSIVDSIPSSAEKIIVKPGFVVERGEGVHTHTISNVENLEVFVDDDTMYLNVLKDIEITHEEHGVQTIEPGLYVKSIERQFDYENEVERRVVD